MAEDLEITEQEAQPPESSSVWLHNIVTEQGLNLAELNMDALKLDEEGRAVDTLGGAAEAVYELSQHKPGEYLASDQSLTDQMPSEVASRFHEYKARTSSITPVVIEDGDNTYAGIGGFFAQGRRAAVFMGTLADQEGNLHYFYNPYEGPKLDSPEDVKHLELNSEHFKGFTRVAVPDADKGFIEIVTDDLRQEIASKDQSQ